MTLSDSQGNTLDLKSLKGRPVLLNLWATWCGPCIAELPTLNELADQRGESLYVLTVSQDMEMTESVAPFLNERGLDRLEPWLDPKSDLPFALETVQLPTTVLYDHAGREVWRYSGDNDWTGKQAAALLAEADGTGEE